MAIEGTDRILSVFAGYAPVGGSIARPQIDQHDAAYHHGGSDKEVQADVFFPSYADNFVVSAEESHLDHSPPFRYVDLIKKT